MAETTATSIFSSVKKRLTSAYEKKQSSKDQKKRIAFAAYINAESGNEEDIKKWIEDAFKTESVAEIIGTDNLVVKQKGALNYIKGGLLRGLSEKQKTELLEARKKHVKNQADSFYDKHGVSSGKKTAAPKQLGRLSYIPTNWKKKPIGSMFNTLANVVIASTNSLPAAINSFRTKRHTEKAIEQDQKDRLLTIAFRDAKNTGKTGIHEWLEKQEASGDLALFAGRHKIKVSVKDVMKNFRRLSREDKKELIAARKEYQGRDIPTETKTAYVSFDAA